MENIEGFFLGGVNRSTHGEPGAESVETLSNREYFPFYSSSFEGPNGTWPPLMAIRDKQYKLHFWTKGSSRKPTGRPDWNYRDATVCAAGVIYWDPPLLFDLYKDPGTAPRSLLPNGTSWHTLTWHPDEARTDPEQLADPCVVGAVQERTCRGPHCRVGTAVGPPRLSGTVDTCRQTFTMKPWPDWWLSLRLSRPRCRSQHRRFNAARGQTDFRAALPAAPLCHTAARGKFLPSQKELLPLYGTENTYSSIFRCSDKLGA